MGKTDTARGIDKQNAQTASDEGQCVVFHLSGEEFGVDINTVREIVRLPDITPIPRSPEFVSGICNLRGSVLPVIDTRCRFSMEAGEVTDQTRLLVVETNGVQTSLLVDHVCEVLRIKHTAIEPPPAVCRGVESEFLTGVVKMNKGERLIMMLNLNELIAVDIEKPDSRKQISSNRKEEITTDHSASEEEQLVSFRVGDDEYAFDIAKVSEILKVNRISAVPNVPEYVLGLFTIRNNLMPILDMRGLLGMPSLIAEMHTRLDRFLASEEKWISTLVNSLESDKKFSGNLDAKKTGLGQWLEGYNTSSVKLEFIVKRLKREQADVYAAGRKLVESDARTTAEKLDHSREQFQALYQVMANTIKELKDGIAVHIREDQRTMVVECESMTIGFLVDWVDEVLRIPRSAIDKTPAMAASQKKELKNVAKLDNGERLIMIMDESSLVSDKTRGLLSDIQSKADTGKGKAKKVSAGQKSLDEEQMVTFSINHEEYGIQIMQVQEINRISEITHIPRAPHFIDGMTNLRGNVIPVVNVRQLFGLEEKPVDDRTRIIIVDINGSRTGLRVDQVNEVLRISSQDIEETPAIVTKDISKRLMQGVCKIDNGKRMIMLLNISEILDHKELEDLKDVTRETRETEDLDKEIYSAEKELVIAE